MNVKPGGVVVVVAGNGINGGKKVQGSNCTLRNAIICVSGVFLFLMLGRWIGATDAVMLVTGEVNNNNRIHLKHSAFKYFFNGKLINVLLWSVNVFGTLKQKTFPCSKDDSSPQVCAWENEKYAHDERMKAIPIGSSSRLVASGLYNSNIPSPLNGDSEHEETLFASIDGVSYRSQKGEEVTSALCGIMDSALPYLGINGIARAIRFYYQKLSETDQYLRTNSLDLWHFLGQYAVRKAQALDVDLRFIPQVNAEIIESFLKESYLREEEYGMIHSSAWTAMILNMPKNQNARDMWNNHVLRYICSSDTYGLLPSDTAAAMCLHGIGHAVMFIAARDKSAEAELFFKAGPCDFERAKASGAISPDAEDALVLTEEMLQEAIRLCRGAPSVEMRYMCGSGLYMTFWTAHFKQGGFAPDGSFDYAASCKGMPWSATCYRWTFRYASVSEVESFSKHRDPCLHSGLRGKDLRGCVWGMVTSWFVPAFDNEVASSTLKRGNATLPSRVPQLLVVCARYLELEHEARPDKAWLACIASAMEMLAYRRVYKRPAARVQTFCSVFRDYIEKALPPTHHAFAHGPAENATLGSRTFDACVRSAREPVGRMLWAEHLERSRPFFPNSPCAIDKELCIHGWRSDILE